MMSQEFDSRVGGGAQFHTTRWTLVIASAQSQSEEGKAALAELCRLYWYPLYAFARRRGRAPHDAQDLTQGFLLHLLEHRGLTRVDRLKGKFRSFLLGSLQNYLANELQRSRSLKRGGKNEIISLDWQDAESRYQLEPVDYLTAEKIYDARWAMTLLRQVMTQVREQYIAQGKGPIYEQLQGYLRFGDESRMPPYEEVAKRMGIGLPALKTLIHRMRKQYTAILREEVGRTVSDPSEIDAEIHSLCDALIAAEGRIGA
ncbi:MAG TPA: sigma factor [Chthoniobacterales bacterium]|jgi:RNA polymerase sigma-70 factor (ECF subfamily)|nr:sigma factor [Chthoniobacterales bacterium]